MNPQTTRLSAWLALCVVSGYVVCPTFCRADASGVAQNPVPGVSSSTNASIFSSVAEIRSLKGEVTKADPSGQSFSACSIGDHLAEGALVQTGKTSMAEIFWEQKQVITRLWSNTLIRLSPGARTVFVSSGEMLFKKERGFPQEYTVDTKRIQARIRGTVVDVQVLPDVDRIVCHESGFGFIEVKNKVNGSVVKLPIGVVLEVRGKISSAPQVKASAVNDVDMRLNPKKGELLFSDRFSDTVAYTANSKAILSNPLVRGNGDMPPIDSIDLITEAMKNVPSSDNLVTNVIDEAINFGRPDKLVSKIQITKAPTVSYAIGKNVGTALEGKTIRLPESDTNFPVARIEFGIKEKTATLKAMNVQASSMLCPLLPITPIIDDDQTSTDTVSNSQN